MKRLWKPCLGIGLGMGFANLLVIPLSWAAVGSVPWLNVAELAACIPLTIVGMRLRPAEVAL